MLIKLLSLTAILLLAGCGGGGGGVDSASLSTITNGLFSITANLTNFAGTVSSIMFNGKQYVNAHDHGRLFQTALQVDGYGECHNPTEAGCFDDYGKNTSTSVLLGHSNQGTVLSTETNAASWGLAPNGLNFCPIGADARLQGKQPTGTIIRKTVILNPNIKNAVRKNVVEWRVQVECPVATQRLGIEILTGYLPATFTRAFTIKPNNKQMSEIVDWVPVAAGGDGYDDNATKQPRNPSILDYVVWSTQGGEHAMAVVRPRGTIKSCESFAYNMFKFDFPGDKSDNANSCVKFSVVSHAPLSCHGNKSDFVVYLVCGTLDQVKATVTELF